MVRNTGLKTKYKPIEKIGGNVYIIRWDYTDVYEDVYQETGEIDEDGRPVIVATGEKRATNLATWMSEMFHYRPSINDIRNVILKYYNDRIDTKILKGFSWNGIPVWLSSENQFNYKAAYDLAIQTQGASLPVTFKFGTDEQPVYHTFTDINEFTSFYTQAIQHVNTVLNEGWQKKDSIDWSQYEIVDEVAE